MYNLFNLKLLKQKIEGFGYQYSFAHFIRSLLMYASIIFLLAYFHHLHFIYIILLIITLAIFLPFVVFSQYCFLNEQKRFQELCIYLKQMTSNFKAYKKIYTSLKETSNAFDKNSTMYKCIHKAMDDILNGKSFVEALDNIENQYKNSYIVQLHSYMILGEKEGGDTVYEAISNIDFQEWQTDTYSYQIAKEKLKKKNGTWSAGALSMSLILFNFFPSFILEPLLAAPAYQIYTFVYFEIILLSFVFITSFLTGKWIREDE